MPIDVNLLREEKGGDPELVRQSEQQRGRDPAVVDAAIAADRSWRESLYKLEQLKKQLNSVNRALGEEKKKERQQQQANGPEKSGTATVSAAGKPCCSKTSEREAELLQEALHIRDVQLPSAAAAAAAAEKERESLLHRIGNIICASVPVAMCESKNAVLRTWGKPLPAAAVALPAGGDATGKGGLLHHHQILARLGGVEFRKGVEVAGHRGYYLKGPGFLFNMALAQYGINFLLRQGYTPVQPPYFMRRDVMARAAELKDFEETLYRIPRGTSAEPNSTPERSNNVAAASSSAAAAGVSAAVAGVSAAAADASSPPVSAAEAPVVSSAGRVQEEDRDDLFLIATSEQPLCALHSGQVLEEKQLPIKYAGYSSCFRKEAGAHGKDCWGIFRIHQFEKVEQFCLCAPEHSKRVHDEMLAVAEEFYQSLDLPYRLVSIVSGALNDAAAKKCDLEAWFPAYGEYRELVSCSNCTDYQARALDIRMQRQQKAATTQQQHKGQQQKEGNQQKENKQQKENSQQEENSQQHVAGRTSDGTAPKKQLPSEQKPFVHMLNGTLVATERCLCCILENYQTPTGVKVPRVLQPYMGGVEFLPYVQAAADQQPAEKKQQKREV